MTPSAAKLYAEYQEFEAGARQLYEKRDKVLRKLVKVGKLGRKLSVVVPISETRGLEITDQFRTSMHEHTDKVFAPAFARRYGVKEVNL